MKKTVFQTVRSTYDYDKLIIEAPFECREKPGELKEWLGTGFYFWETFQKLAHWWGRVHYQKRHFEYIICKTVFECESEQILDFVNDTDFLADVQYMITRMRQCPEYEATEFTAQFIIDYIRKKTPRRFKAIRAWGRDCCGDPEITDFEFFFNNRSSIHLCPEIQICVIDKSVLKLPVEIIYNSADEIIGQYTV